MGMRLRELTVLYLMLPDSIYKWNLAKSLLDFQGLMFSCELVDIFSLTGHKTLSSPQINFCFMFIRTSNGIFCFWLHFVQGVLRATLLQLIKIHAHKHLHISGNTCTMVWKCLANTQEHCKCRKRQEKCFQKVLVPNTRLGLWQASCCCGLWLTSCSTLLKMLRAGRNHFPHICRPEQHHISPQYEKRWQRPNFNNFVSHKPKQ